MLDERICIGYENFLGFHRYRHTYSNLTFTISAEITYLQRTIPGLSRAFLRSRN